MTFVSRRGRRLTVALGALASAAALAAAPARASDPSGDAKAPGVQGVAKRALDLVDTQVLASPAGLYVRAALLSSFERQAGRAPLGKAAIALLVQTPDGGVAVVTRGPSSHSTTGALQVGANGKTSKPSADVVRDGRKVIFFLPGLVVPAGANVQLKSFASLAGSAGRLPLVSGTTRAADTEATRVPAASSACDQLKAQLHGFTGEIAALGKRIAAGGSTTARSVRGRDRLQSARTSVTSQQGSLCGAGGTRPSPKQPVTIGPDLGSAPDTKRHTTVDTVDIPLAPNPTPGATLAPYAFPVAGNVTEFKVRGFADGGGAGISFLIIHPEGGGRYTAKQYAGNFTLPGADGVSSFKTTYRVPVLPGDTFAIYNNGGVDWHVFASAPSAGMLDHSQTTLNEGDSFSPDLVAGTQVLIDATEAPS